MGKGSGGGTNTVTNNSAPPPEVMEQYRNIIAQGNTVAGNPLQQYSGPMLAGFTPDQMQAFQTIQDSQGISSPYLGSARTMLENSQTPIWDSAQQFSPQALQQYMDPYTDSVVNATMGNLNETFAQQREGLTGDAISKGAWGGDRAGIAQAELARQQGLAAGQTIGGLRSQGFGQALNEFNQQQGAEIGANTTNNWLASQGSYGMANLGAQAQSNALQGAAAQLATGQQQQTQNQAALNIPYEQFLQQQAFPYQNLSWLSSLSTGLGSGMGGTSTSQQPGPSTGSQALGTLSSLGTLGYLGYLAFSDRRLKDHIRNIGKYKDYPLYEFRYKGDNVKNVGVMAQDVEKSNPGAVRESGGYKMVDYSKLARGGGIRPAYARGGITGMPVSMDIPDFGASYIPGGAQMQMTHGSGVPDAPQAAQQQPQGQDSSQIIGLLSALAKAKMGSAEPDVSQVGTAFTEANAQANGLGDMVKGFRNPDGTTNLRDAVNINGDSVPYDSPNMVPDWRAKLASMFGGFGGGFSRGGFAAGGSPYDDELEKARGIRAIFDPESNPFDGAPPETIPTKNPSPQGIGLPPAPQEQQTQAVQAAGADAATMAGLSAARYGAAPNSTDGITNASPLYEPDPIMALLATGAAIGAGTSPFFGVNAGEGALQGIKVWQDQKKQAAAESERQGNLKLQAEKLFDDANEWRNRLYEDTAYKEQYLDVQNEQNAINRARLGRDGWEVQKMPNGQVMRVNKYSGEARPVDLPAGIANQNGAGFEIGTIPDGLIAPVVPENFNTTHSMTPGQRSIAQRKYQDSIKADMDAADLASSTEKNFKQYLSVNKDADSGGLSKIGLIRDMQAAFNDEDATADSINKSLTFQSLGGERVPGMRITQAEFLINREAMPGRGNGPGANRNIANYWIAKLQRPQEWAKFKGDYMLANEGDWNEALGRKMFEQYTKDNPIFDPEIMKNPEKAKVEQFKLNPNRKTLDQYAADGGWNNMKVLGMKPPVAAPAASDGAPAAPVELQGASDSAPAPAAVLTAPPPITERVEGKTYQTPKGPMIWTKAGWIPAGGQ